MWPLQPAWHSDRCSRTVNVKEEWLTRREAENRPSYHHWMNKREIWINDNSCISSKKCRTNWVEVDVTILLGELLQVLQSHMGSLLHCLQVLLTVESIKVLFAEWLWAFIAAYWGGRKVNWTSWSTSGLTCEPAECLSLSPRGQEQWHSDQLGRSWPKHHDSLSDARVPRSYMQGWRGKNAAEFELCVELSLRLWSVE